MQAELSQAKAIQARKNTPFGAEKTAHSGGFSIYRFEIS